MTLQALAERAERYAPTGNHYIDRDRARELHEAIAVALGKPLTVKVGHEVLGNERMVPHSIPDWLSSLDAVMALVPPEKRVTLRFQRRRDGVHCAFFDANGLGQSGTGYCEAAAFLAAALRAHASQMKDER